MTDGQTGRVTFFFMASSCSFIAKHFFVLSIASLSSYSERQHTVSVAHPLTLGLNRGDGGLEVRGELRGWGWTHCCRRYSDQL